MIDDSRHPCEFMETGCWVGLHPSSWFHGTFRSAATGPVGGMSCAPNGRGAALLLRALEDPSPLRARESAASSALSHSERRANSAVRRTKPWQFATLVLSHATLAASPPTRHSASPRRLVHSPPPSHATARLGPHHGCATRFSVYGHDVPDRAVRQERLAFQYRPQCAPLRAAPHVRLIMLHLDTSHRLTPLVCARTVS